MVDLHQTLKLLSKAEYADVKYMKQREVEIGLRHESSDVFECFFEKMMCRAVSGGYGAICTSKLDKNSLKRISKLVLKHAKNAEQRVKLAPVKVEEGRVEHGMEKEFDSNDAHELLKSLREQLHSILGKTYARSELVISYRLTESALATSEGTKVIECTPMIDITLYLIVKRIQQGFAGKTLGGRGGLEIVEGQDWNHILEELTTKAKDGMKAKSLPPTLKGGRFKVLLDSEGAGVLAHELAHMLEADVYQKSLFRRLKVGGELEIIDNPTIPQGYGSFTWDDEGVKVNKKILLKEGIMNLLHTRSTASGDGEPGNAHGVIHMPRPMVSNVHIKPADWKMSEMFEDTRNGIYTNGVIRAECDTSDGKFELIPEISYLVKQGRIRDSIKHLRIVGNIIDLIQRVDAVGDDVRLRPNIEKGFCISEGGPHIRIDGATCF